MLRLLLSTGAASLLLLYGATTVLQQPGAELTGDGGEPGGADVDGPGAAGGAAAFRRGDDATALRRLHECLGDDGASPGARAACRTVLGEMHLVGAGVPKNLTEAWALFQAAADAGDPEAQFNLALLHSAVHAEGDDVYRHEALAVLNLYAASTAGHQGALMAMGYRHQHGYGVPQACTTAVLNYIDIARKAVASMYRIPVPPGVSTEPIRLDLPEKERRVVSTSVMSLLVQLAKAEDPGAAQTLGRNWLLGVQGFRQDYGEALRYLSIAAKKENKEAKALLGYMHYLGLGVPQSAQLAHDLLSAASLQGDPLGHNGLGEMYLNGTTLHEKNDSKAFKYFKKSADRGSTDGMFNLAFMYMAGRGVDQSYHEAVEWYKRALRGGHTRAAYPLAVMQFNGIGANPNCDEAVKLLRAVCERSRWVIDNLADAYELVDKMPDRAALFFLKLAEAGHEIAQVNAAHMFDTGQAFLFYPGSAPLQDGNPTEDMRQHGKLLAQRYYEMSAERGSVSSELRLGDYAYYGWGASVSFREDGDADDDAEGYALFSSPVLSGVQNKPQAVDHEVSLARYRRTAETGVSDPRMQAFVARGSFNVGFMHQFGLGVQQDLQTARMYYERSRRVGPGKTDAPASLVLLLLGAHALLLRLPAWQTLLGRLLGDARLRSLALHLAAIGLLAAARSRLAGARRCPAARGAGAAAPPA